MVLLLSSLVAAPGFVLLALAVRRRLPLGALPAAAMLLPAEVAAVVGTVASGTPLDRAIAAGGLVALVGALVRALATADTQLSPWWWSHFTDELARWESTATVDDGSRLI